jgi:protein-tyrosine-phosphatase
VSNRVVNVLFLCTGNSARSVIAESLLNAMGEGRFRGYSAGSHPSGHVNPLVLAFLAANGIDTRGARSKSWDEFAAPDAPSMDLVVTVCDDAAAETCPVWPGHPAKAHWSAPDPARHADDAEAAKRVIRDVYVLMRERLSSLVRLAPGNADRLALQAAARATASVGDNRAAATDAQ